jgi:hypothetical protein
VPVDKAGTFEGGYGSAEVRPPQGKVYVLGKAHGRRSFRPTHTETAMPSITTNGTCARSRAAVARSSRSLTCSMALMTRSHAAKFEETVAMPPFYLNSAEAASGLAAGLPFWQNPAALCLL